MSSEFRVQGLEFRIQSSEFRVQDSGFRVQSRRQKTKDQRSKIKISLVCLFIGFSILACVKTQSKRGELVIADSKSYEASLFRQNCAICHGAEANGKEEPNGTLIPSLRYGEAATLSEQQIYTQIHDGKLPMPAFKNQLTDDEIKRMVKFVRHDLQGKTDN